MIAVNRSWIMSSASSHEIRSKRPEPRAPRRRKGVLILRSPCTKPGYAAGTLAHSTPAVYGLACEPRIARMRSFSTVTVRLHVSGQSRGQTLWRSVIMPGLCARRRGCERANHARHRRPSRSPPKLSRRHGLDDRVDVVDTATPRPSADVLQRRPQPRVIGQIGVGRQIGAWRSRREHARALVDPEVAIAVAHEIDRALQAIAVDDDLDQVAVQHLADGTARERFRTDVADAGAG